MAAVGDVYEITMIGDIFGQTCENIFHYYVLADSSGLGKAGDVAAAWETAVNADWALLVSVEYTGQLLKVYNLVNPNDFIETASALTAGTVTGDCLPSFASWGFTYTKAYRGARDGSKRIAGVAESAQANGIATITAQGFIDQLALDFTAPLTPIAGMSVLPCVLQTPNSAAPFPRTYIVTNVVGKYKVTSQNSRKIGIGI